MLQKTRLNVIIAGAFLAAFGLIFAWATLVGATGEAALNALSAPQRMRLGGSVVLFAVGTGLSLYAALGGRRLR